MSTVVYLKDSVNRAIVRMGFVKKEDFDELKVAYEEMKNTLEKQGNVLERIGGGVKDPANKKVA